MAIKTKRDSKGNIESYRTRFMEKAFNRGKIIITVTLSPVSFKIYLSFYGFELHILVINSPNRCQNWFLSGVIEEHVYV